MDEKLLSRAKQLAEEFASSATTIDEVNQLMRLMMKSSLEKMLNMEIDVHLCRRGVAESPAAKEARRSGNRRNGRSKKTVQGELGEVKLSTLRDREGSFEPQIIEKHQRRIPDFDENIFALYAKRMTTRAPFPKAFATTSVVRQDFVAGHVSQVQAVFNAPVLADIAQEIGWGELLGIDAAHIIASIVQHDFSIVSPQLPINT